MSKIVPNKNEILNIRDYTELGMRKSLVHIRMLLSKNRLLNLAKKLSNKCEPFDLEKYVSASGYRMYKGEVGACMEIKVKGDKVEVIVCNQICYERTLKAFSNVLKGYYEQLSTADLRSHQDKNQ
jgi:hypothetical protein